MEETAKAYAAGFIDGEGHIRYTPSGKQLQVSIPQVDRAPLEYLQALFGGHILFKPANGTASSIYTLQVYTQQAVEMLRAIAPYLIVKRAEAEGTIAAWDNRVLTKSNR